MLLEQDDEGDRAKARYLLEEPAAISNEPGMQSLAELDSSRREILERSLPHGRRLATKMPRPWSSVEFEVKPHSYWFMARYIIETNCRRG